jgi:3-hydroxyacyl-CoA dehydrogenase
LSNVDYRLEGEIAVLTLQNPPMNALSAAMRTELVEALERFTADRAARAAILIGANGRFVPGADIREFGQNKQAPGINVSVQRMQAAGKPVVAAIAMHALGGGLELALGAHFRVATPDSKLGLPEVNIGLLPGGGGTQRLPRVVGAEKALDLILSGRHVRASEALELGLLDEIVKGDLLVGAIAFVRRVLAQGRPLGTVDARTDRVQGTDPQLFARVREKNARRWKGLLSPQLIVECVEKAVSAPIAEGLAFEADAFRRCVESPQRAALIHVFQAERAAAKIPGLENAVAADVKSAAVVGAGTMGSGIAMCFANAGVPVVLLDATQDGLDRGLGIIRRNYETSVKRGSLGAAQADKALSLVSTSLDYASARDCDIVVEAAFEDMELKKKIFATLDAMMKPGAVLATNTSTLDIDQIAEATARPEAVVGTHFFSPANVMKLQENVRGSKTSPDVVATVTAMAKKIGKVPVLAGNRDGFIGNRILAVYGRECDFLLEEGATPWQIDRALQGFGFPMGLYLMRDMSGLDVGWRIRQYREQFRDKALRYSPIADRLCEQGRFGQKTGKGYYLYDGQGAAAKATPDPAVEALIEQVAKELGIQRRTVTAEQIVNRVLTAMVNEGARILDEGVAQRASDIDVTYIHGYGFPRYEGGPMFWAERKGLAWVLQEVRNQHAAQGKLWEPAPTLEAAAARGRWAE